MREPALQHAWLTGKGKSACVYGNGANHLNWECHELAKIDLIMPRGVHGK